MRFQHRLLALAGPALFATLVAGCPKPRDACGGCGPAQLCDPPSRVCQPALPQGSACVDAGLPCAEGTVCEVALTPPVCAPPCDPSASVQGCAAGQGCFTLLVDGGPLTDDGGAPVGLCASIAAAGAPCGAIGLSLCGEGLACIVTDPAATDGLCEQPCDPSATVNPCATPAECLALFPDPSQGICAQPIAPGQSCDLAVQAFCPKGQLCLGDDAGSCYVRCEPGDGGVACPELQACVTPTSDPSIGVCAQPVPDGQACDPNAGLFCGPASYCVTDSTGLHCHAACGTGTSCPQTEQCLPIVGADASACG
ncbi:MAG: hypothetical protein ACYCWW_15535 [Deltaproteobacteria bacterium]